MAPLGFLQGCRPSKSIPALVDNNQTHLETERSASNSLPRERPSFIVLPILIMICSIAILILSVYGIAAFHGNRTGEPLVAAPTPQEVGTFPLDVSVCSLCIAILGVVTILYQIVSCKIEQFYKSYVVFALCLSILAFSVGAIVGYGIHAVDEGYFEGIQVFYSQISLIIALLVLIVVHMILSGNPITEHRRSSRKPSQSSLDEENAQLAQSPVLQISNHGLISHDGADDIPRSTTGGLTQLDAVHYNPADPYHPLRLNPPEYSDAMEMSPKRSAPREQEQVVQVREQAPEALAQEFPVYRERSCVLRWLSWSRDGE